MFKRDYFFAAFVSLSILGAASAAPQSWVFPMDGLQEVPPVATPGFGSCTLDFDDVTGDFDLACTFQDLIAAANNAHIHGPADYGVNAGILVQLAWTSATSGTVTGSGTFSASTLQHVLDHMTYVNVHSSFRPGGEIRGQMVPEPTSALLLALGATTLIARRRRRCSRAGLIDYIRMNCAPACGVRYPLHAPRLTRRAQIQAEAD